MVLPLSCPYPTGINTLPNPATDILHPPSYEDGTDKEFRNVGYQEPDAGESPKKEQITASSFAYCEIFPSEMFIAAGRKLLVSYGCIASTDRLNDELGRKWSWPDRSKSAPLYRH